MPDMLMVLGWLATYLLHSTLWLGAVLLAVRGGSLSVCVQERALRLALLGGVATTALQCGLGTSPCAHLLDIVVADGSPLEIDGGVFVVTPVDAGAPPRVMLPSAETGIDWPALLLWCYAAVLALSLVPRWRFARRLRHLLTDRTPEDSPAVLASFHAAADRAGVRAGAGSRAVILSRSDRIRSPMAWGWFRPEVCLPSRTVRELDAAALRCVLLHELAHLRGRDPMWQRIYRCLTWLAWFQPLNRVAVRRLQNLAEYRCDDFAIRLGCGGTALASTLLTVAEWQHAEPQLGGIHFDGIAPAVTGMAAPRSLLGGRVHRALHGAATSSGGRLRLALALPALLGIAWGTPAVSLQSGDLAGLSLADLPAAALLFATPPSPPPTEAADEIADEIAALQRKFTAVLGGLDEDRLDAETRTLLDAIRRQFDRVQRLNDSTQDNTIQDDGTLPSPAQPEREEER